MAELCFSDSHTTLYKGDCRYMSELADNSVDCVVTSPPYLGLRKYKDIPDLICDGDPECEHVWGKELIRRDRGTAAGVNAQTGNQKKGVSGVQTNQGQFCQLCGAWRGSFGMEPTIEMYIEHSMIFLQEIRRVLKPWGTVWWNLDDSRAGSGSPGGDFRDGKGGDDYLRPYNRKGKTIKPGELCLIPERFVLAAQKDGWWVKTRVIWHKPSTMPESVNGWRWERHRVKVGNNGRGKEPFRAEIGGQDHDKDGNFKPDAQWADCPGCPKCQPNDGFILRKGSWRPTDSYEFIFQLTKTKSYYGDREAIAEKSTTNDERRPYTSEGAWEIDGRPNEQKHGGQPRENGDFSKRNLRSVWSMTNTGNHPKGHFAVFPEELPRKCILASTSEWGNCPKCGMPWVRVVDKKSSSFNVRVHDALAGRATAEEGYKASQEELDNYAGGDRPSETDYYSQTLGWRPSCKCFGKPEQIAWDVQMGLLEYEPVPAVVLDPFAGTGTTLWVAKTLGRIGIGYEISEEYCQMAIERTKQGVLL